METIHEKRCMLNLKAQKHAFFHVNFSFSASFYPHYIVTVKDISIEIDVVFCIFTLAIYIYCFPYHNNTVTVVCPFCFFR